MPDPYDLQRFLDAQEGTYETALAELSAGSKRSHWMWFIFPQLAGLGRSPTAQYYAIASLDEACAYLAHHVLGPRLRQCVEALLRWKNHPADEILGSVDAMKLRSSLTLFDHVEPDGIFGMGIEAFYAGKREQRTLALLNARD